MGTDSTFADVRNTAAAYPATLLYSYRDTLPIDCHYIIRIYQSSQSVQYVVTVSRTVFFTYLYSSQNYPQTEERHLDFCCRGTSQMRCARRRHSCERVPLPTKTAVFRNTYDAINFQSLSLILLSYFLMLIIFAMLSISFSIFFFNIFNYFILYCSFFYNYFIIIRILIFF